MDDISKGLITLIRSALTGESLPLPEGFSLQEAYPLVQKHQIPNIVYEGAVNCGVDKAQPIMKELFQKTYRCLVYNARQMAAIEKLYKAFDSAGIDYMPLKGCNLKRLYPKPEMRIMGDADILIRIEQYEKIESIIQPLGYHVVKESNHELVWDNGDLHLELHKRIVADHHAVASAYYGDGWSFAKVQEGTRYAMTPEDELVYLFSHFTVHYREGGIGCRQLMDIWIYQKTHPQLDQVYLRSQLKNLQLLDFYDNICKTIDAWFADRQQDAMSEYIIQVILSNGSWGTMEKRAIAQVSKNTDLDGIKDRQRKMLLWSVFPALPRMQQIYPVLHKAPVLLPVMWAVRWCGLLLKQRKRISHWVKTHESVDKEAVAEYQAAMAYVGLSHRH